MTADWELRFRAPKVWLPEWAEDAPDRCLYVSNQTGIFELHAWDRSSGMHRQVTSRPNGTTDGRLSPDGLHIWWFDDSDGDEFGVWRRQPFGGGPDQQAAQHVPAGYSAGLEIGRTLSVIGTSTDDGTTIHVVRPQGTSLLYASSHDASVAGLSRDESLVLLEHSEHGDSRHPALRVMHVDGTVIRDLWDGEGRGLHGVGFSPAGGAVVLAMHEQDGRPLPLLWDPVSDHVDRLDVDLAGDLNADWYADGSALLVVAESRARSTLHRVELDGTVTQLATPAGSVTDATARPGGIVEFSWSSAAEPSVILAVGGPVVLRAPEPVAPSSVPVTDAFVKGPGGTIHALVSVPTGVGPWPTLFHVHGGPHHLDEDAFYPERAAFVDLGCAVVDVNYRGSTGYGSAWRDAITGRPGLTELEDVEAVVRWAVDSGLADPARCVINGASWGGYLALLAVGTQPALWAAAVAAVPVADYVAAFEDEMEPLKAFDSSLFGGSPQEVPDVYERCSPLTYVADVVAPVLVTAGANDPRCPIRQIDNYLAAAAELGKDVEVYRYDAGHGSLVIDERVKQARIELDFVARRLGLPGPR
ncbi:MAG: peptidase prolyl oligopeptidase active site domain protein [Frankiales bacterium]|nr:peptidase prolyl oligopeptidase active site domain protein [Frankiales bacterium]